MNRPAFIISIFALTAVAVSAQAQDFTTINPNVRTAAMADVSTAVSGGTFSIYDNAAAALFDYKRIQLGFTCLPQKSGGATSNYYSVGGYYSFDEKNTIEAGTRIYKRPKDGDYQPFDISVDVAYALLVHDYVGVSVTAHYLHGEYGNGVNSNAIGFDVATYAQIPLDKMLDGSWVTVGAKVADIGFALGSSRNNLPSRASVGAALFVPIGESHSLMGSIDAGYRFAASGRNTLDASVGAEYTLLQLLSLRGGYHFADKYGYDYATAGAGISFMMLNVDFSYLFAPKNSPLRNVWQIGVGVSF